MLINVLFNPLINLEIVLEFNATLLFFISSLQKTTWRKQQD
jgi:hypothetical protein